MTQKVNIEIVRALDDENLISLYGYCAKILSERGMLPRTKKALNKVISSSKTQTYNSPKLNSKGKVKRHLDHSILIDFLNEDWKYLFKGDYDESREYYVYYHTDPHCPNMRLKKDDQTIDFNGRPFYVGKGKGSRYKSKLRSRSHLAVIKQIKSTGASDEQIFHIFESGLSELEAIELEAKLITFFGCSSEVARNRCHFHGMKGGLLINSDPARRPAYVNNMIRRKGL